MKRRLFFVLLFCIACGCIEASGLQLPSIFSDHAVLQRGMPVKVWGKSAADALVTVEISGNEYSTVANEEGNWTVVLPSFEAGGPYDIRVSSAGETCLIEDVLFGEVWLCSGQSNMEFKVKEAYDAANEMKRADYPMIRAVNVPHVMNGFPQNEVEVKWEICSPSSVGNFTAVGYFYALNLYKELNVPIGIINSSWGSTGVRTWMSREAFDQLPQRMKNDYDPLALNDYARFQKENADKKQQFESALKNDKGMAGKWYEPGTNISDWKEMNVPCAWVSTELGNSLGNVWYCRKVQLPESATGKSGILSLGIIDDGDRVWVNGTKVGEGSGSNKRRIYNIAPDVLCAGENTIVVQLNNSSYTGGFISVPDDYYLETSGDKVRYSLSGKWKYKKSAVSMDFGYSEILPNIAPSLLYNAMIHPFVNFAIRGAVWYQGEHDTKRAYDYQTMFPALIEDWRKQWGYDFPFYWVSLANMNLEDQVPKDSQWAELREAQTMTLSLPYTGQAVIYDIGDALNIHPVNKQEVGRRLALLARNKVYGEKDLVCEGPVYESFKKKGNKIVLRFRNAGKGLSTKNNKYGYVTGFSIAGEDKRFEWAKAYIQGDEVVVYSDKVEAPVAVRYAWSDNPGANLCNKEGLLVVPFRTDDWKGCTEK